MNATIGNDNENFNCLGKNNDPLPTNGNGRRLITLSESNDLQYHELQICYKSNPSCNLVYEDRIQETIRLHPDGGIC